MPDRKLFVRTAIPLLFLMALAPACAGTFAQMPDMESLALWAAQAGLGAIQAPAPAPAASKSVSLRGFSSSWIQDCSAGCGLPSGVKKNDPVDLTLALPDVPGEFRMTKFSRAYSFQIPDGEVPTQPLEVAVSLYAVCPRGGQPSNNDPCPARYFQAQIELSGEAAAQCGVSLNQADVEPFPVMTCGALLRGKSFRIGVSLHRVPL